MSSLSIGTTWEQDQQGKDLIGEAFEKACQEAEQEGCPYCEKRFPVVANIDTDVLWEKLMAVIGVTV